jgi:hypothetical protein
MATGAFVAAVVALPAAGGVAAGQAPAAIAAGLPDGDLRSSRDAVDVVGGTLGSAVAGTADDDPFGTAPDALPVDAPPASGDASALASNGIPDVALRAYQAAAGALALADPTCRLDWALLAGIGRVESNHGRYGGAEVGEDGVSWPSILGVRLDGSVPDTVVIEDSDRGRLDGDRSYDRAVGPMQFLPGSWSVFGTDGDGDGTRDPQNIHDAALAAAAYLCSGTDDLSTEAGAGTAVRRYNNSGEYVRLVLDLADAYRRGTDPPVLPIGADPDAVPVLPRPPAAPAAPPTHIGVNPGTPGTSPSGVDTTQPTPPSSSTTTSSSSPTPTRTRFTIPPGSSTTSPSSSSSPPTSTSTGTPTSSPTTSPTSSPTSPTSSQTTSPTGSPTGGPTSSPTGTSPPSGTTTAAAPTATSPSPGPEVCATAGPTVTPTPGATATTTCPPSASVVPSDPVAGGSPSP